MATLEACKRGYEVLSKFHGGSIMMVLAVEGLKVRCADRQNIQYWFDTIMLERYEHPGRRGKTSTAGTIAPITEPNRASCGRQAVAPPRSSPTPRDVPNMWPAVDNLQI